MRNHQHFLRYAAEQCDQIAKDYGRANPRRKALERMARMWRHLADQEERVADILREVDNRHAPDPSEILRIEAPAVSSRIH